MKGLTTYKITMKERLRSIAESKKVDGALLKHYTFILEHFDEIIAKHDNEIAKIEEEKVEILKQFIEAPELLKELAQHISELSKDKQIVAGEDKRVKKFKSLRERLEKLEAQMKADGVNISEIEKNIEDMERETQHASV